MIYDRPAPIRLELWDIDNAREVTGSHCFGARPGSVEDLRASQSRLLLVPGASYSEEISLMCLVPASTARLRIVAHYQDVAELEKAEAVPDGAKVFRGNVVSEPFELRYASPP